ncbi:MAG: outer membrane insertion C- signal [Subdoligranulum sp.]|nr:outer membrane insertion C- signal [Subdoligranulum sp.]
MSIPVYLFTGFLDGGKTTFIQETLEDPGFCSGEKTLVLLCEEGEVEYEPQKFAEGGVQFLSVEDQSQLTTAFLKDYQKKHRFDRVLIEYNGMWPMQALYDALPRDWEIYQIILVADSTTFESYLANMRQLAVDKLQDPEMVIFNRCTDATDKAVLHRAVRMVNRRAQMAFERTDGSVDPDDIEEELPFDLSADVIDIADEDYGLWYLDAADNVEKYKGKTVRFKAYVCQTPRVPKGCFVPGRFGMTCCAEDISFIGFICEAKDAARWKHRSWVTVTARVDAKRHPIYEGVGPWLKATNIEPAEPPQEELVYFLR